MIRGENVYMRPFIHDDAEASLKLQEANRAFFENYSMYRSDDFYTLEGQLSKIRKNERSLKNDDEYHFGVFLNKHDLLIGTIQLFQVIRGSLQSAFIGYFLDKEHNGKGYMTEAVRLIIDYAFLELDLHRIEAGVMPDNTASIRVLEKSGFHKEGIARQNVKIRGKWEDHQVLAIINPNDL